jgi:glycosyltransferase involved in cell wall biosynthesis
MKLLYFSPASYGGLADYAHAQANALSSLGIAVTLLCAPDYPTGRGEQYEVVPILRSPKSVSGMGSGMGHKVWKAFDYTAVLLSNYRRLAEFIEANQISTVLLGAYAEYLAPLWCHPLQKLAQTGVTFGAIVHDPVRDFTLGPRWWHRWSVACAYSMLRYGFVHEAIVLDTYQPMPQLQTVVIPIGPFQFPPVTQSRSEIRTRLNLPQDATVLLSFGHIRDGKNLDLLLQAITHFPNLYLIVAGKEQSSGQRPAAFYQDLATQLKVHDRCRWQTQFIPDNEVGNFFEATDLVVLTYSKAFRSASGVLNAAACYRKPCLASSGPSVLQSVVKQYDLGIWVEPDSPEAIVAGLHNWLTAPPQPQWEQYCEDHSWTHGAKVVMNCLNSPSHLSKPDIVV